MVEDGCFRPYFHCAGCRKRSAGSPNDRRHPPQGAPHRVQSVKRGDVPRAIGCTKGGLNSKLHAVCDGEGRPVRLLLTEGQQSDHKGAATLLPNLPPASELLGDKGYDSDAYRTALIERGRGRQSSFVFNPINFHSVRRTMICGSLFLDCLSRVHDSMHPKKTLSSSSSIS